MPEVSIVVAMDRVGPDPERCIERLLGQRTSRSFEIIVVGGETPGLTCDTHIRTLTEPDRNPAVRRNGGVALARGRIFAFIDDDAFAAPEWLETAMEYLDTHPDVLALGGPDPAPLDSPLGELVSDTLLSTRWIGSGILCHEVPDGVFRVRSPHDLALVNLFVRREAFEEGGGFDPVIGYVGEDTALLEKILERGAVVYHSGVIVRHRRRAFPGSFLRQRWRYRVKTGRMLVSGPRTYRRSGKLWIFLGGGAAFVALLVATPLAALALLAAYGVAVTVLAIPSTRLPWWSWPLIPFAFLVHHANYFAGIVTGAVLEILGK